MEGRFFLSEPRTPPSATGVVWIGLRTFLRLIDTGSRLQSWSFNHARFSSSHLLADRPVAAQRFERAINDRRYVIEATLVDPHRWRAYLVSVPGGPAALMPFYGETPEQAVQCLTDWLALANRANRIVDVTV